MTSHVSSVLSTLPNIGQNHQVSSNLTSFWQFLCKKWSKNPLPSLCVMSSKKSLHVSYKITTLSFDAFHSKNDDLRAHQKAKQIWACVNTRIQVRYYTTWRVHCLYVLDPGKFFSLMLLRENWLQTTKKGKGSCL